MANVFLALPLPVGNGAGAAVDTSTMGGERTIIVEASIPNGAQIAIEGSSDGGVNYFPIPDCVFTTTSKKVVVVACDRMRTRVSGRPGGVVPFTASVAVAATDAGGLYAALALPAGDGVGASVDVSAHGPISTFQVAGSFPGSAIAIQGSSDGTDWATIVLFAGKGGAQTVTTLANFYRTFVSGRSAEPFVATVAVGSINEASGGGGGGGTQYVFVFQPGGVPADNVYDDWATLYAAMNAVEGERVLQFDDSFAPIGAASIPNGVYDMQDVTWVGTSPGEPTLVTLGNVVSFTNLRQIGPGIELNWTGAGAMVNDFAQNTTVRVTQSTLTKSGLSGPMFELLDDAVTVVFDFIQCFLEGSALGLVSATGTGIQVDANLLDCTYGVNAELLFLTLDAGNTLVVITSNPTLPFPQPLAWGGTVDLTQIRTPLDGMEIVSGGGAVLMEVGRTYVIRSAGTTLTLPGTVNPVMPGTSVRVIAATDSSTILTPGGYTINGFANPFPIARGETVDLIMTDTIGSWIATRITESSFSNVFVYRPGGDPGGNVFPVWEDLMVAIGLTAGNKIVMIDDSITSPATIPAGAYDLADVTIAGFNPESELELDATTTFTNLRSFGPDLDIAWTGNDHIITDVVDGDVFRFYGVGVDTTGSSQAMILVDTVGAEPVRILFQYCYVGGGATNSFIRASNDAWVQAIITDSTEPLDSRTFIGDATKCQIIAGVVGDIMAQPNLSTPIYPGTMPNGPYDLPQSAADAQVHTADFDVTVGTINEVDISAGSVVASLPATTATGPVRRGTTATVKVRGSYPIVLSGNQLSIGSAVGIDNTMGTCIVGVEGCCVDFVFNGTLWQIVSFVSGTGQIAVADDETLIVGDDVINLCDASGGNIDVLLPSASVTNRVVRVKSYPESVNNVLVTAIGADTIDGFVGPPSTVALTDTETLVLQSNGLDTWYVISGP